MYEMGARAGPQDHVRAPQIAGHLLAREHGAIGDVSGDQRLAVADDFFAHLRPHAVAADERAAPDALARLKSDDDAGIVLLEVLHRPTGLQRDEVVVLAGVDEHAMEIVPMGDGIRLLESL